MRRSSSTGANPWTRGSRSRSPSCSGRPSRRDTIRSSARGTARGRSRSVLAERIAYYEDQGLGEQAAQAEASRWVAQPGTSEHELGLAVDINDEDGDEGLYAWLDVHAHEYGFIKRYPEDASQITGISHEPWHYRYVGTEAARDIYLGDLTLEEYLGAA